MVTRLLTNGRRVTGSKWRPCANQGERTVFRGREVILAAGALATPQLLLASDWDDSIPAGR